MHRKKTRGWAGIVDGEELPDEAKTDPNFDRSRLDLDNDVTINTSTVNDRPKKLRLPRPDTLPGAQPTNNVAVQAPPPVDEREEAETENGFSSREMMDRLEASRLSSQTEKPASKSYRELVITVSVGVVLLIGALVFQLTRSDPKEDEADTVTKLVTPKPAKVKTIVSTPPPVETKKQPPPPVQEQVKPSSTPMVTILSKPLGAMVEIDGVVYGKTPLIMTSPVNKQSLAIGLKLENHKRWEGILRRNEAGHFTANVKMKKMR